MLKMFKFINPYTKETISVISTTEHEARMKAEINEGFNLLDSYTLNEKLI